MIHKNQTADYYQGALDCLYENAVHRDGKLYVGMGTRTYNEAAEEIGRIMKEAVQARLAAVEAEQQAQAPAVNVAEAVPSAPPKEPIRPMFPESYPPTETCIDFALQGKALMCGAAASLAKARNMRELEAQANALNERIVARENAVFDGQERIVRTRSMMRRAMLATLEELARFLREVEAQPTAPE